MLLKDAIYSTSLTVSLIPQVEMNSFSLCSVFFRHSHNPNPNRFTALVFRLSSFVYSICRTIPEKLFSCWYFFFFAEGVGTLMNKWHQQQSLSNKLFHLFKLKVVDTFICQLANYSAYTKQRAKRWRRTLHKTFINDFLHSRRLLREI